ncbi:MAG: DMT family transporter [Gammaproteobacteria bacterium]|nr:DMT family transporter [Gammaproteobacteria bacterium]
MAGFSPSPYLLLVLTTLFWSGNFVIARMVRLEVPPIGLSFWRWGLAGALLLPFVWRDMYRHRYLVREHLLLIVVLALLGVTGFNTMVYLGLQSTTASNGVLLQSIMPLLIILLSWVVLGVPMNFRQSLGVFASLIGVVIIVTKGDIQILTGMGVTRGDLWILTAVFAWGLYSVLLKKLPLSLIGPTLLGYTIVIGLIGIVPLYIWEISTGIRVNPNPATLGTIVYVAVFASLLAFLFWNRAVRQVGPNRAGQFIHLIPVFGSVLSVFLLGERLHSYHLVGIFFVALGIYVATETRRKTT